MLVTSLAADPRHAAFAAALMVPGQPHPGHKRPRQEAAQPVKVRHASAPGGELWKEVAAMRRGALGATCSGSCLLEHVC